MSVFSSVMPCVFVGGRERGARFTRFCAPPALVAACIAMALAAGMMVGVSRAYAFDDETPDNDASIMEGSIERIQLAGSTSVDNDPSNVVDPAQKADNSFIYDTTIASLAEESTLSDGQTVQVSGEVIGDRIATETDGFCWITLEAEAKDDSSTISVYMPNKLADQIDEYGRYGVTGSRVQVRGEYHQACKEHDGLSDIHATTVEVTAAGVHDPDKFDINKFVPGAVLIAVGIGMVFAFNMVRERRR